MIDKEAAITLLGGTIARGVMWAAAAIGAKYGLEAVEQDTATGIGVFVASAIVAIVAMVWSKKKDKKLKDSEPTK